MIQNAKYYSIIMDCTPDAAHEEPITTIFRFVLYNENTEKKEIREHFLGFYEIKDSTSAGLTLFSTEFLKKKSIEISNMRGQGYMELICKEITVVYKPKYYNLILEPFLFCV